MSTERYPLEELPRLTGLDPQAVRSLDRSDLTHELALMCRAAAQSVMDYLVKARTVLDEANTMTKRDFHDPVTPFDRATEASIGQILGSFIPGSRILGEERGEEILPGGVPKDLPDEVAAPEINFHVDARSLASRVRWIVDPIDGTANFAAGFPYFGTSIAAELDGEVVASAITIPYSGETFWANETQGWLEAHGKTFNLVSDGGEGAKTITKESEGLLLSYFPTVAEIERYPELASKGFAALSHAFRAVRRPGASALDLAQISAGRAGGMIATRLKPWDVAAGMHLVKVSGGTVHTKDLGENLSEGLRPAIIAAPAGMKIPTLVELLDKIAEQY